MDGGDRVGRRKTIKERLGLNGISCCGATWGFIPSTISVRDDDDDNDEGPLHQVTNTGRVNPGSSSDQECDGQTPHIQSASGMNLAAALAAERQFRAGHDSEGAELSPGPSPVGVDNNSSSNNRELTAPGTPYRVSLMRLLEEADGVDGEMGKGGDVMGCGTVCCVCMGRKKGAAFIPCGHTFCRVCSRELWLNRGSCPLCNRPILEILDIF